jgi:hypothetical protein
MPLEPFDPAYLEEHKIKSMSFHSYLKKLGAHDKTQGTSYVALPSLEEPSFKVKTNCSSGHPPWPASICTKCQPSAITLQRQVTHLISLFFPIRTFKILFMSWLTLARMNCNYIAVPSGRSRRVLQCVYHRQFYRLLAFDWITTVRLHVREI